jgi:hypothetical protein
LSKPTLIKSCRAEEEEVPVLQNWKQRAQERKQWKEMIEQANTHKEL